MLLGLLTLGLTVLTLSGTEAAAQSLEAENLLVTIPEGFELGYEAAQGSEEIHEFIPVGESVEAWSAMVTIQIFRDLGDVEADRFAANLAENWTGSCEGATAGKLADGDVNGFPFTLWTYVCPVNPATKMPETMYFKGISGSDAFYSVQYAFRNAPADELDDIALPYLVGASACDTRKADRPCPEGM